MEGSANDMIASTSEQNMEGSDTIASTSEQNTKNCDNIASTNMNMEEDCVTPTNWKFVKDSANNDMPCTSGPSAEGSGSEAVRRCSLCKKELITFPGEGCRRRRISAMVDLKTAKALLPHLSPEEFICSDPCAKWVYSQTKPTKQTNRAMRTWIGFSMKKTPLPPVPFEKTRMHQDSTNTNSDGPSPAPSEPSAEGSSSEAVQRCSLCKKELIKSSKGFARRRISTYVDLETARKLLPHLSPEEFICIDVCEKWLYSKTKPLCVRRKGTWVHKRTWIDFSVKENPLPAVPRKKVRMDLDHDSTNTNSEKMEGSDYNMMASTSEQNVEGSDNTASTSEQNVEGSDNNTPSTSVMNMEEDCVNNIPSTKEQNMEKDCVNNIPSTKEQNMGKDCVNNIPSTKEQSMGKDCVNNIPSTVEQSMEKLDSFNKKRTWAGSGSSSSVDSTPPPSKRDKANVTVGGGVPALPPAPTSTQNTEGPVRYVVVIPKSILSVSPSKQNEDSVNLTKPCKPNMNRVTAVGPSASMLNMAGSVKKPPTQNMGASVEAASTSKPNVEGTVSAPLTLNDSPQYVVVPRLPPVLPTNWNVINDYPQYNDMPMPCTSEQGVEGSCSEAVRRCSLCKKELIKTSKGLNRRRISSYVDLETAKMLLPHLSPEEFICGDVCVKWLYSKTKPIITRSKRKGNYERLQMRTWIGFLVKKDPLPPTPCKEMRMDHDSTNTNAVSTSDGPSAAPAPSPVPSAAPKKGVRVGKINGVIANLRRGRHVRALRRLLELPTGAAAFNKVCQEIIRKERIKLARDKEGPFRKQPTPENLSSFSWKETNAWVEEKAPLTLMCLRSMFPPAQKMTVYHRTMTEEEAQQLLDKRIGMVMSIAQFTGSSLVNTFVQSVIGVEMWREGCSQKVFRIMNSLGLSQCRDVSRKHIVRLQDDHDKEVKLWKRQVESDLRKYKVESIANRVPAYSLTWDRVKIASHAKHGRLGGNTPTIWAFRFAHRNRIPFSYLQGPQKMAVEVSPDSILPSKQTYEALRQRMKTIVMRIIVDNLTALEGLRSKVVWHIPHLYSEQMKEKSNVVNLGAVPVDSSTTEGDRAIMGSLIEYVPYIRPGSKKPHQVLCCSDGLNVDTTEEPSESTARQRFEGLVDAPPEYHKESLCFQDITKMLCSEKSLEARGSLSQLKSVFAVRGQCIEGRVKETIQHVWDVDFITFVTSAYITLYAATECNLDTVDQQPSDFPTDAKVQMEWLSGLAHRLVDLVWMPPPQEDINAAAATASLSEVKKSDSCFCGEEKAGEPLVQCSSNVCGGVWFHEGCAPMDTTTDPSVTQDWFCSPECQEDGTYIYCYCKEQRGGQMVQCALMDQCRRHEWYHKDCLSLSEQGNADSEESTWYCSEMCFIASDTDDHVLNYTKALVWEGLYNMTRRDAIREGDGEAMTDFWKMDMVLFWARNHLKDFTTCHRLLTGIEGFYPEHIRQDLKWNRVANLEGKPGGNISLDLVNEFMNVEFKESLARVSYHYTNDMMKQCGMMAGALGSEADRLLVTPGAGNASGLTTSLPPSHAYSRLHTPKRRRQADIATFVADYKKDHLFRYIPGRAHRGFEKFAFQQKIPKPKVMGMTMRNLAQDMDLQDACFILKDNKK